MKKTEAETLLKQFVEVHETHRKSADLHIHVEWLFRMLSRAGLLIKQSPRYTPRGYQIMVSAALRYLAGDNISIVDIRPVKVKPIMEAGDKGKVFELGQTGPEGLLFCLRFLMEAVGVKRVRHCRTCGKIIFTTHGRQKYCDNNNECKNRFNYLRNKKEAKK